MKNILKSSGNQGMKTEATICNYLLTGPSQELKKVIKVSHDRVFCNAFGNVRQSSAMWEYMVVFIKITNTHTF
jgi:hypothetical protein